MPLALILKTKCNLLYSVKCFLNSWHLLRRSGNSMLLNPDLIPTRSTILLQDPHQYSHLIHAQSYQVVYSLQVLKLKSHIYCSFILCMLHILPISSFYPPNNCIVKGTNYDVLCYKSLTILKSLPSS